MLHSAFKAPVHCQWTRNPPLAKLTFTRTRAICQPDGNVVLIIDDEPEEIEIAHNWQIGERMDKNNPACYTAESGYIGAGYSKRGIYV